MKEHIVKIKEVSPITHDVRSFVVEKPQDYRFEPGQATEVAINKSSWKNETRPFTFTSLPKNDFLQFIIKIYPDHKGVTRELGDLKAGDELILKDVFGAINYQGSGTFIAGGAGITPFIAILRHLKDNNALQGNRLIFANKKQEDIILRKEFEDLLGDDFVSILSEEKVDGIPHGIITKEFLKSHINNFKDKFYVCGPPPMMEAVPDQLVSLGIPEKEIIMEDL